MKRAPTNRPRTRLLSLNHPSRRTTFRGVLPMGGNDLSRYAAPTPGPPPAGWRRGLWAGLAAACVLAVALGLWLFRAGRAVDPEPPLRVERLEFFLRREGQ